MQQLVGQIDEDMNKIKEQFDTTDRQRDQAIDKLKAIKKVAKEEMNNRSCEDSSTQKIVEMHTELNSLRVLLSDSNDELKIKQEVIDSLKYELEMAKGLELKLAEKGLANGKVSESERRIRELEAEVEKGKESEKKMFDSMIVQIKRLEETQILFEESKLEIASLREKVGKLQSFSGQNGGDIDESHRVEDNPPVKEAFVGLKSELQLAKGNLESAEHSGKAASKKAKSLIDEMGLLKNELKLATEAEENSKKALDDLALALKEVATEANQVKEKLGLAHAELEHSRGEEQRLMLLLKSTEERFKGLLEEAWKEAERSKNTAERLRLEAEESLHAWNGKETGFVDCIRRAEEETSNAHQENARLLELLTEAENNMMASKAENGKVRDILKQALNEANVAKEAAEIAKAENSQLKDSLAEKEEALVFLARENENYRVNEAAALENIKELKRMLYEASFKETNKEETEKKSPKELKKEEKHSKELRKAERNSKELKKDERSSKELKKEERNSKELKKEEKDLGDKLRRHHSEEKEQKGSKKIGKTLSLNLKDLKILTKHEGEEEREMNEALRGSIFDVTDSPVQETIHHHIKKSSSGFSNDDGEAIQLEDLENLDGTHFDDLEGDRSSGKKKALLRRFGELLIRKRNFHRKEQSLE
ncbi:hypothetical protein UlMin_044174 [Ulmus minor]